MKSDSFFAELKRRNVYKVAVAYAIVGWLLVQIATQVFPFLEIPNWVVRLVIALVAIGFPIALVIAWAFELTPEGLKSTKYKSKPEDLKTVSQQLGVANVLEGSVQKAADKVRVNVQLIDARADSHLWAKTYDRGIQDIFAVESEVAQEIADSLKAKLSPAEANTLATAPTKDPAAYDLFLKGEFEQRVANSNFRPESFHQAERWYKEAIARDPNFALAIAQLAMCQLRRHWLTDPLSESELAETGRLAKQAVTLAPDLAEAHIALGLFHYYGFREYEPALTEFQRSIEVQPNNALAIGFVGFVHRRQGKWDRTLDELKRSIDLNPRDPRKFFTQGSQGTRKALRLTLRSLREIHLISGRSFIQRIYHRIRILFILCCKLEIIFLQQTNRLQISRAQLPFNRF